MPTRRLVRAVAAGVAGVLALVAVGSFGTPDRYADPSTAPSQLRPVAELAPLAPATTAATIAPAASTAAPRPPAGATGRPAADDTRVPDPGRVPRAAAADVIALATPERPVRILVVGDSTAWSIGDGLAAWAEQHPELASVTLTVAPGCGFLLDGAVPADDGADYVRLCAGTLSDRMNVALRDLRPDVVLLMATRTDVKDRVWSAAEGPLTILDERYQERQRQDYRDVTDWILGSGAPHVVWVKPPVVRVDPAPPDEMTDPDRIAALHSIIDATVEAGPFGSVTALDLAGWYSTSGIDDREARIDGMHFELPAATEIASRLVGPSLVNVALGVG